MIVGQHRTTHEIVVLADDRGLPIAMTRDAEGRWRHDCFDALTMMEDVVDICDPEEQQKLLAAALDAYRQDQRAAVCR